MTSPSNDFYQAQIDAAEYRGEPYPVAAVGVTAALAAFDEFWATCRECDGPNDDAEDRLCDTCRTAAEAEAAATRRAEWGDAYHSILGHRVCPVCGGWLPGSCVCPDSGPS